MARDRNGVELKVGDEVVITARVAVVDPVGLANFVSLYAPNGSLFTCPGSETSIASREPSEEGRPAPSPVTFSLIVSRFCPGPDGCGDGSIEVRAECPAGSLMRTAAEVVRALEAVSAR